MARVQGRVSVEDLAGRFSVTPQTIRKDLNELCGRHLLSRVHGGAVISCGVENIGYEARRFIAREEKRAIGAATARVIPDNSSLFDCREVRVSQAIIGNARQVILVSDRLKFERSAPVRTGTDTLGKE